MVVANALDESDRPRDRLWRVVFEAEREREVEERLGIALSGD